MSGLMASATVVAQLIQYATDATVYYTTCIAAC